MTKTEHKNSAIGGWGGGWHLVSGESRGWWELMGHSIDLMPKTLAASFVCFTKKT